LTRVCKVVKVHPIVINNYAMDKEELLGSGIDETQSSVDDEIDTTESKEVLWTELFGRLKASLPREELLQLFSTFEGIEEEEIDLSDVPEEELRAFADMWYRVIGTRATIAPDDWEPPTDK
jgi:Ca2+-dependent lipid-binding protein